jgi:hypothetical protein
MEEDAQHFAGALRDDALKSQFRIKIVQAKRVALTLPFRRTEGSSKFILFHPEMELGSAVAWTDLHDHHPFPFLE